MNKKIYIIILVVVLALGGGILYLNITSNHKEEDYKNNLTSTIDALSIATSNSAVMASTYQDYWGKSIDSVISSESISNQLRITFSEYEHLLTNNNSYSAYPGKIIKKGEFNTVLKIVTLAKTTELEALIQELDEMSGLVSNLKNPPEKYESEYNSLLEIFEKYNSFNSLATLPVGTYIEYSKNINSLYEEINSKIKTLKLQID